MAASVRYPRAPLPSQRSYPPSATRRSGLAAGCRSGSVSSQSTRVRPCPCLPRRSQSAKCSASVRASAAAKPSASIRAVNSSTNGANGGPERAPPEIERGPAARGGDPAQRAIGIDGDRTADRLEERQVGDSVAVGGRSTEVDVLQLEHRGRLAGAVAGGPDHAGKPAAGADLADRADRPVEPQRGRERRDDLLQRRRHEVDRPAGAARGTGGA